MDEMNKLYHHSEHDKPFDFHNFINRFFRRRRLFFYIAIPVFLISIITQITKPYTPLYRATFDIGVAQVKPVEGFFSATREAPALQIGTATQRVIANLLSVNLAEKVVDNTSICAYIKNANSDIKVEARLKKDFREPIGPLKLKTTNGNFSVFQNGKKLGEGRFVKFWSFEEGKKVDDGTLNEYVDFGFFELKITPLKKISGTRTYELIIYPKNRMALALRNSISIEVLEADKIEKGVGASGVPFAGEGASKKLVTATSIFPGMNLIGVLRISVHWSNRDDALELAEVLSEQIILEDRSEKSLQFIQSRTFIDSQLALYQNKLNRLEDEIRGFKEKKKITDLTASTRSLISQMSDLESRKNALQIEEKILSGLEEYLVAHAYDKDFNFAVTLVSDPVLQNLYSELLQTEAELRSRLKEYSIGHPKVLGTQARLDGLREQMKDEAKKRISAVKTEIASVSRQIGMLQGRLERVPKEEVELARLGRDRETAEKLYTFFAERLEETRVQEAGVTSDLRIINPPMVSSGPVNTRDVIENLMMALVLGIFAGGFAVFVVEYIDRTVKDPDTVVSKTGLPVFASIPFVENEASKKKNANLLERVGVTPFLKELGIGHKKTLYAPLREIKEDMASPEFEAFRKLAMNLDLVRPRRKFGHYITYQIIYITSSSPDEGKTFIALNLGVILGTMGKKTILVDTDFRKRRKHLTDITRFTKRDGIFDVLAEKKTLKDVIVRLSDKPIDLISVGRIPANPFILIESEKMKQLIEELKQTYDYVLIDGVPVLLFADATYLANCADGVLLTAKYGSTSFKDLENSRDILLNAKAKVIGLVMNGVPKRRGSYYYDYYYKHYSKYYDNKP